MGTLDQTSLPRPALVYAWLAGASVMCLLVADVIGSKLFEFHLPISLPLLGTTLHHSAGMLAFPITFLITDWLNEYYGKNAARRVVIMSFTLAMLAWVIFQFARALPHWDVPFNVPPAAFEAIFGSASVMYIASLCAYLVNNLLDIFLFGVIKRATGGKYIWLRATGSTLISQAIDSLVVTFLGLYAMRHAFPSGGQPMPLGEVIPTAATGYMLKFVLALAITPLLYLGHYAIRRWAGMTPLPPESRV
ncbi:MAG: queuosine precursor transporter [Phycisphaerales bacterium]|jgi:hypothetical protein|nr:queuosine precursor transporter [Phycisphaerales bacterium]